MLQTSIAAWLKKPATVVQQGPRNTLELESEKEKHVSSSNTITAVVDNVHNPPSSAKDSKQDESELTVLSNPTLKLLKPNIRLASLTSDTLPSFRRLNTLLLEIPYPQKFYDEILSDPITASITLAAFWHTDEDGDGKPVLVAGIRCRLLSQSALPMPNSSAGASTTMSGPPKPNLYIATLSTLSPYRSHGLATHLLQRVTSTAVREHGVGAVCAHVWVKNEDGLAWYKRRGFDVVGTEEGYYRRLKPQGAWLVRKRISVQDMLEAQKRRDDGVDGGLG